MSSSIVLLISFIALCMAANHNDDEVPRLWMRKVRSYQHFSASRRDGYSIQPLCLSLPMIGLNAVQSGAGIQGM